MTKIKPLLFAAIVAAWPRAAGAQTYPTPPSG